MKPASLEKKWKEEVGKSPRNPNSVWDALDQIERDIALVRPENSFTVREYAQARNLNKSVAKSRVDRMERLGQITKHKVPGGSVYYTIPVDR